MLYDEPRRDTEEIPSIKSSFSGGGNVKMSWFGSSGKILAQHQLLCPGGHRITPLVETVCLYEQCLCPGEKVMCPHMELSAWAGDSVWRHPCSLQGGHL